MPLLPTDVLVLLLAVAFIGALVQGVVGFGLGTLLSPVVALFRPDLVPVAVIVVALLLPVASLVSEGRRVDWPAVGWIMLGRLPATVAGVWVVTTLSSRALQGIVAGIVLVMVALSLIRIRVPRRRSTLAGAGLLAGITGTSAGIGGPPVAIVLADDEPPIARATMAVVFLAGMVMSLAALGLGGALSVDALAAGLVMVPAAVLGFALALVVRGRVGRVGFRRGVLAVSTLVAILLLGRVLAG